VDITDLRVKVLRLPRGGKGGVEIRRQGVGEVLAQRFLETVQNHKSKGRRD